MVLYISSYYIYITFHFKIFIQDTKFNKFIFFYNLTVMKLNFLTKYLQMNLIKIFKFDYNKLSVQN